MSYNLPPWLSSALISWMLPRVPSRIRHATEHPAVQQPLSMHPHVEDNSRQTASCSGPGEVYLSVASPLQRIFASGTPCGSFYKHDFHLSAVMMEDRLTDSVCGLTRCICQRLSSPACSSELC